METPHLPQNLFSKDFENVYEPSEDTFLLLDAIEMDLHSYQERAEPIVALECGSGSGTVITALSKSLNNKRNIMIATDINMDACRTTRKCARYHGQNQMQVIRTNLAECLVDRLTEKVDVLIFNPPYVPTDDSETEPDWKPGQKINLAWAGGTKGRKLTDTFLSHYVPKLLSVPHGVAYLIALKQNNVKELSDYLIEEHSIRGSVMIKRRAGQEVLHVIKYERIRPG